MASLSKSDLRGTRRFGTLVLVMAVAAVAGCADYLNNNDRVAIRAGNAPEANSAIQTIQPWPPEAYDTDIEFGG